MLALAAIAAPALAQGSTIEFNPQQVYIIPGVDKVDEALFNDVNYDGLPEVLVRRGNHIQIYSKSADSVVFQTDIDPARWQGSVFADVNRDSVVDIAVACFHDYSIHNDSALTIDVYNGAAGNSMTRRYYPNAEPTAGPWLIYSSELTAFKAVDANDDGYDELILSYCNWIWDGGVGAPAHIWHERQFATSKIFYSYPDSTLWQGTRRLSDPVIVGNSDRFLMMNNLLKYSDGFLTDSFIERNSVIRFDTGFDRIYTYSDNSLRAPSNKNDCINFSSTQSLLEKCAGNLIGANSDMEFIASFKFLWDCYEYGDFWLPPDSEGIETRMYRMPSPDSAELVWVHEGYPDINYIFMPDYPGYYFAFHNSQLVQFDGATGEEVSSSQQVPAGLGHWDYPFRDNQPYWVTYRADTVTIYAVGIMTDADEGEPLPLPATLSLGKPYPNPFNATQTIPITVRPGEELTVNVYNLLGQKIQTVYSGTPSAATLNLTWRADHLPSGVYFVRATSGDAAAVVRSILLK